MRKRQSKKNKRKRPSVTFVVECEGRVHRIRVWLGDEHSLDEIAITRLESWFEPELSRYGPEFSGHDPRFSVWEIFRHGLLPCLPISCAEIILALWKSPYHNGTIDLSDPPVLKILGDSLSVPSYLDLQKTPITSLPDRLRVGGTLNLWGTPMTTLPPHLHVGWELDLRDTKIQTVPEKTEIGGRCDFRSSRIVSLPNGFRCGGSLDLRNAPISKLPENVSVEWALRLRGTAIKSVPAGIQAPGGIELGSDADAEVPSEWFGEYRKLREQVLADLPEVFRQPRQQGAEPPPPIPGEAEAVASPPVPGSGDFVGDDPAGWVDVFCDEHGSSHELDELIHGEYRKFGFDAIAWYQPFHIWSEDTWGIYFHVERLLDFARNLWRSHWGTRGWSLSTALRVTFQLVYEHEMFHACVEAAATWHEFKGRRPVFLTYIDNVFKRCRESPSQDWLEEALANWKSQEWLRSWLKRMVEKKVLADEDSEAIRHVMEYELSHGPPGYRDWTIGNNRETWKRLGAEIAAGKQASASKVASSTWEWALRDGQAFEFSYEDIPVHLYVSPTAKAAADTLFLLPSYREVVRVLRARDFEEIPGRGKGSHSIWKHPSGKTWTLPHHDRLSPGVFRTLLDVLGVSKRDYMAKVRTEI